MCHGFSIRKGRHSSSLPNFTHDPPTEGHPRVGRQSPDWIWATENGDPRAASTILASMMMDEGITITITPSIYHQQ
jgi:hypothetical protein